MQALKIEKLNDDWQHIQSSINEKWDCFSSDDLSDIENNTSYSFAGIQPHHGVMKEEMEQNAPDEKKRLNAVHHYWFSF